MRELTRHELDTIVRDNQAAISRQEAAELDARLANERLARFRTTEHAQAPSLRLQLAAQLLPTFIEADNAKGMLMTRENLVAEAFVYADRLIDCDRRHPADDHGGET